jgi:hypothetical protein
MLRRPTLVDATFAGIAPVMKAANELERLATEPTFQADRSRLNATALRSIRLMLLTDAVFHALMSALKAAARMSARARVVTLAMFQPAMFWSNRDAP